MVRLLFLFAFSISITFSYSQANEFFKVEFDAFTPPIQAMLDNLEGSPAKNFMMKDLNGKDVTLSSQKGKKVVLWFWENTPESTTINEYMEVYSKKFTNTSFISLFNGKKDELPENTKDYSFMTLPNAAFLGEAVYDKELGTPRMYLISDQGIVKLVLPAGYLEKTTQVQTVIENFLNNKIY